MGKRKDLGRVGKRYRAFTGGVERGKQVDEEGDQSKMRLVFLGNDETQSGGKQCPCHLGKGENQKISPSPGINRPHRWPRKHEVDQAVTPTCQKCLEIAGAGLLENRRRVERDDIRTAHLLSQHDDKRSKSGTSDSGNGEKFDEASDVIAAAFDLGFFHDLGVDVVEITSSLDGCVSKPGQRFICVCISAFLDIPSRGLRAEIDTYDERYRRNKGRTELQTERDISRVVNCEIRAETKEDTKGSYISHLALIF